MEREARMPRDRAPPGVLAVAGTSAGSPGSAAGAKSFGRRNFAWERRLEFPSIRRRYRARFRPAELSSRNFRSPPPNFRRLLPCSIPTASWL